MHKETQRARRRDGKRKGEGRGDRKLHKETLIETETDEADRAREKGRER